MERITPNFEEFINEQKKYNTIEGRAIVDHAYDVAKDRGQKATKPGLVKDIYSFEIKSDSGVSTIAYNKKTGIVTYFMDDKATIVSGAELHIAKRKLRDLIRESFMNEGERKGADQGALKRNLRIMNKNRDKYIKQIEKEIDNLTVPQQKIIQGRIEQLNYLISQLSADLIGEKPEIDRYEKYW